MAALLMRRSISKIREFKPKNKYVIIHGCFFLLWCILFSLYAIAFETQNSEAESPESQRKEYYLITRILAD